MFCSQCGKELPDGSRFCSECGAKLVFAETPAEENPATDAPAPAIPVPEQPEAPAPAEETPAAPEAMKKGLKPGAAVGVIAALVVVGALIVCLVAGVFSGPKGAVQKAVQKSARAYAAAIDALEITDLDALRQSGEFSESYDFTIRELNGESSLAGAGARTRFNYSASGRAADFSLTPFTSDGDVATVNLVVNDNVFCIGSPELTDGKYYGADTTTLGRDVSRLTGSDELKNVSFNFFDVVDELKKIAGEDAVDKKGVEAAAKKLEKATAVTKDGKETIDVNGKPVSAVKYTVRIPHEALKTYLDDLSACTGNADRADRLAELVTSMGFDESYADAIRDSYGGSSAESISDSVYDLFDKLGDVEYTVYIKSGYVVAMRYEGKVDGSDVSICAMFGYGLSKAEYVNEFSLIVSVKDEVSSLDIELVSLGDHAGGNGIFTDTTRVHCKSVSGQFFDESDFELTCKSEYSKKTGSLSVRIDTDDHVAVVLKGTLKMDAKSLSLDLDEISMQDPDVDMALSAACSVRIGSYDKSAALSASDVRLLADMDEDELSDIAAQLIGGVTRLGDDVGLDLDDDDFDYDDDPGEILQCTGRDDGIYYGYDAGYDEGYGDGWYELDFGAWFDDDPEYNGYSGDADFRKAFAEGYEAGYYDGYYDGYPGYEQYSRYGKNRPAMSTDVLTPPVELYDLGLSDGYDAGYDAGYLDGWQEVTFGETYDASQDGYADYVRGYQEGYEPGYYDGYWDGYPGESYYTSYYKSAAWMN